MPFTLRVTFSGPCLFVPHCHTNEQVAVLMPDARRKPKRNHREEHSRPEDRGARTSHHPDDEHAEPHVGYLRVDAANLDTWPQPADGCGPPAARCDFVYRFNREELEFEGLGAKAMTISMDLVPDFDQFFTGLKLVDGLFEADAENRLVMRTILRGGCLKAKRGRGKWRIPRLLAHKEGEYAEEFASSTVWEREIGEECVTLHIKPFGSTGHTCIRLRPSAGAATVEVDIANLCAHNPLEWSELPQRRVRGSDEDFKWLYQLLTPDGCTYRERLKGAPLPAPRQADAARTGDEDCMGGRIAREWPLGTEAGESAISVQYPGTA